MNRNEIVLILFLIGASFPVSARNISTILVNALPTSVREGSNSIGDKVFISPGSEKQQSEQEITERPDSGYQETGPLKVGMIAPDFISRDDKGNTIHFYEYKTNCRYKLVLFWSADCNFCKKLVHKLYPWYEQLKDKTLLDVIAISVDETRTEVPKWEQAKVQLPAWRHIRVGGGMNGQEVHDYGILITPKMILVDSSTNKVIALPKTVEQLSEAITK